MITDGSLGTIPGRDGIDTDGDGSYGDDEISAYLGEDDAARRVLLRDVLRRDLSDAERRVLEAVASGDDPAAALAAVPGASDAWKAEVRALADRFNTGNIRIAMNGGSINNAGGDGIRAWYAAPSDRNGAIAVTVAEGASVTGGTAGIYVANAGATGLMVPNRYAPRYKEDLDGDADVPLRGYLNQPVTVHGTVTGGTDAAVHLSGGGALIVGSTGKLVAGSSGRAILVNDPGPAYIHIDGAVTGGAGGEAAVHLAGGGTVTIRPPADPDAAPRVDANGAARAIRGGGTGTTTTVEIEATGSVRNEEAAHEIASKAISGSYADIGGNVTVVQTHNGVRTGRSVPVSLQNGILEEPTPTPTPPPAEPPREPAFNCAGARDGRCGLYEAMPSVLLSANGLPSYAERASAARDGNGGWARLDAVRGKWRARTATTSGGLAYDHRRTVGRAGLDLAAAEDVRAGMSVHFLGGKARMSDVGEAELEGLGVGFSGTWLTDGFHVDAQAGVTWYGVKLESDVHGDLLDGDASGRGYALGLDAGQRLAVGDGLTVTPRAGLEWSKVGLGDFREHAEKGGALVSVEAARSLKGRVGVSAETEVGSSGLLFGTLDVEREFSSGGTRVDVGADVGVTSLPGNVLSAKVRRTAVRVGVGGRFSLDGNVSLSASGGYGTGGSGTNWYGGGVRLDVRF